ncbi:alginate lyase family protein [Sanguibacteroides sp. AM78-02pH3A]|uniref:alginate lyase family protein n=1 Tax=Sanguibacteroides sp. AM78-02pH3A TaxID=3002646 RepID=UPI0022E85035|nr:alginate lyase family protein [Sanguibacteroides sp. AM78-02pH3A]
MNFIPRYIFFTKLLIVLNDRYNRLLSFVPAHFLLPSGYKKTAAKITKARLQKRLAETLGNFQNFPEKYISEREKEIILRDAGNALSHRFELLGSGPVTSDPIDWHCDFKSGHRWPGGKYYKKYIRINKTDDSDVKVPIELSRCHHLLWLGEAYLITGDERYPEEIVAQIRNWIKENPYAYSINWSCAMDVAIRAVNWIYTLNMIISSDAVDDRFCQQITGSLLEHIHFIYQNLEKGAPYSGNHYASNLTGLVMLGLLFQDDQHIKSCFEFGKAELFREIRNEVLPTGVHYEKSISYHRLMTELFAYPVILLQKNGYDIPPDIHYRIRSMFDFIRAYTKPDGSAPLVGDNDDGRLLPFVKHAFNRHDYLLSVSARMFGNTDYESGTGADAFFLLPEHYPLSVSVPPESTSSGSKIFPDAGFAVLKNEHFYIFFNNSGIGMYYPELNKKMIATHNHADLLSFDLSYGKCNVFTDAGAYVYTSSLKAHNEFRSTGKHNTINIDGCDQYHVEQENFWAYSGFNMPSCLEYSQDKDCQRIAGAYTWTLPGDTVTHKRTLELHPGRVLLADEISATGEHLYQSRFMLDAGIKVESVEDNVIKLHHGPHNRKLKLEILTDYKVTIRTEPASVSYDYGCLTATTQLIIEFRQKGNFRFLLNISSGNI